MAFQRSEAGLRLHRRKSAVQNKYKSVLGKALMSQIAHFSVLQSIISCLSCCFHYSDGLLFLFNILFDTMLKTVDFIVYCLYFTIYNKLFVLKRYGFFNFVFNNLRFFVESQVEIGFTNRNIFTICNFIRRLYTVFFRQNSAFSTVLRQPSPTLRQKEIP